MHKIAKIFQKIQIHESTDRQPVYLGSQRHSFLGIGDCAAECVWAILGSKEMRVLIGFV
jgi:hypothetical protein